MIITDKQLTRFQQDYDANPNNRVVENAIANVGLQEASLDSSLNRRHPFTFSHTTTKGEITNQKSSGRCWMFSALNTARVDTMTKLNLETFEFSQTYTLFWDKLEKSNYFLESILETVDEATDSRIIMHLLTAPVQDGGQWDMFAGILSKYGAVPKCIMPETFHSSNTMGLNRVLTSKLRENAYTLRTAYRDGKSMEELRELKEAMLSHLYSILVKSLGPVPTTFTFEYTDKDEKFHRISDITPVDFFKEYVGWNLEDKVSLINAPTTSKPFGRAYTVKFLGTVKELYPIRYINVDLDTMKRAAIESIKNNEPVWFGCDVGKQSTRTTGILDAKAYQYELTLNQDITLTKGQRLDYGESLLTHAMVFTGVNLDNDGNPLTWQVENSWGDQVGQKGIFSMSDDWFDEYNYQIMVDKKYLSPTVLEALDKDIIELEPWDPMGALALTK